MLARLIISPVHYYHISCSNIHALMNKIFHTPCPLFFSAPTSQPFRYRLGQVLHSTHIPSSSFSFLVHSFAFAHSQYLHRRREGATTVKFYCPFRGTETGVEISSCDFYARSVEHTYYDDSPIKPFYFNSCLKYLCQAAAQAVFPRPMISSVYYCRTDGT